MTPTHDHIEALLTNVILPFHRVQRDIDLPLGSPRPENDVEHSWSVAVLACCLAPAVDPTLDVGKIAQFAIIHDLVEVFAGDTSIFASPADLASKAGREHAAMLKIQREYQAFPWLGQTIADYESKQSPEAQFVSAVDKYIALHYDYLDKGVYLKRHKITKAQYDASLIKPAKKAHLHPKIGEYYNHILDLLAARPDFFHPNQPNTHEKSHPPA